MNADWIKRNAVIIIFVAGFVLFLAYDVMQLRSAYNRRQDVEVKLEQEVTRLNELIRGKTYPSNENLTILRSDRERMEELYHKLVVGAARPIEVPEKNRVQFRALLTGKLNSLTDHAEEMKITLPDGFAFGFDQYLGILPPDNKQVLHTLTKQLLVIEKLCETLYASGVQGLTKVGREDVAVMEGVVKPQSLYATSHFDISFTCDTKALQQFLNNLTKLDWFFGVRTLDLQAVKIMVANPAAPVNQPAAAPRFLRDAPAAFAGAAPAQPAIPAQIEQQVLEIKLRIDLIEIDAPVTAGTPRS